jgi:hypothetical protein
MHNNIQLVALFTPPFSHNGDEKNDSHLGDEDGHVRGYDFAA